MRVPVRLRLGCVLVAVAVFAACDDSHGLSPNMRAGELMGEADLEEDPGKERALAERAIKILREHIATTPPADATYWHARTQIVFAMQWIPDADVVGEVENIVEVHKVHPFGPDHALVEFAFSTARRLESAGRNAEAVRVLRVAGPAAGMSQESIDPYARGFEEK
jgi:hypothetical protein